MNQSEQETLYTTIEELLRQAMGLKVASIGRPTLDRALNRRIRALNLPDTESYVKKLKSSVLELRELVEEVVIPETWFFRDKRPFDAMLKYLTDVWMTEHKNEVLRLLSVPCATGEEPYSLAMALLDNGWPINRFRIDAVDISSRSLSRAKEALYSNHSFRGHDVSYRDRYFTAKKKHFQLNSTIRNKVHFYQGNILNPLFMDSLGVYHILFCRNLLIYLDSNSRDQALATLDRLLTHDGLLFVGHAEASLFTNSKFTPAPYPQAFAFLKKQTTPPLPVQKKLFDSSVTSVNETQKNSQAEESSSPKDSVTDDVTRARNFADQGRLEESARICEQLLKKSHPPPEAYFLLGVINDANGNLETAIELLRKALYLDPDYLEALVMLSLLVERSGDKAGAQNLKKRAQRVVEKKSKHERRK
jgi:chemotaxis protein methyltransferase WspC